MHYLDGWPAAEARGYVHCDEHPDTCAKKVSFIDAPIVRKVNCQGGRVVDLG